MIFYDVGARDIYLVFVLIIFTILGQHMQREFFIFQTSFSGTRNIHQNKGHEYRTAS